MREIYKHKVEKLTEKFKWFIAINKKKEIANELFCFEFTLSEGVIIKGITLLSRWSARGYIIP